MTLTRVLTEKGNVAPAFGIEDRVFLGEGLFETIKVVGSHPCFAQLHWNRLSKGAEQLGIPFDLCFEGWFDHLVQQIKKDNMYHGGIKAILSGGIAPRGLTARGQHSQLIFSTFNYQLLQHPVRLMSGSWLRDEANPIYKLKSVNYLEAILAKREALAKDFDDALFFNQKGYATESTCANIFLIKDDKVFTPALNHGVLAGITRERILSLCTEQGLSCTETDIDYNMLTTADGIFITNSLQGIRCVSHLDEKTFNTEQALITKLKEGLALEEAQNQEQSIRSRF